MNVLVVSTTFIPSVLLCGHCQLEYLEKQGVKTDISWRTPPFLQPCMVEKYGYKEGDFPVTEELCAHIVTLPMMDHMDEDEITTVINAVNSY